MDRNCVFATISPTVSQVPVEIPYEGPWFELTITLGT
jgi:hypothetical protein